VGIRWSAVSSESYTSVSFADVHIGAPGEWRRLVQNPRHLLAFILGIALLEIGTVFPHRLQHGAKEASQAHQLNFSLAAKPRCAAEHCYGTLGAVSLKRLCKPQWLPPSLTADDGSMHSGFLASRNAQVAQRILKLVHEFVPAKCLIMCVFETRRLTP